MYNFLAAPFGQQGTSYNPSQGTPSNPSWSNPHFKPGQSTGSYPPGPINQAPGSTNIGFKDHLRPATSMPVPSATYPHSYPTSGSNPYPPPYPSHSYGYSNQPHSTYNPSYSVPGHTIGHPSSYPAHIPPPVPGTFGNPYSTHPVGNTYGATGHSYYPQQHVLAQPAAQPYIPGQTVIMVPGQQNSGRGLGQMVKEALVFSTINAGVNRLLNPHHHYVQDYSGPARSSTSTSETHITYNNHYFNSPPPDNSASGSISSIPPNVPPQGNIPTAYPHNPSPVNNPVITPGVSIPTIVNNGSTTYSVNGSSVIARDTVTNEKTPPVAPPEFPAGNAVNDQGTPNQGTNIHFPQYRISDDDLMKLTEELFVREEIDISKYLSLHLQSKSENVTDSAGGP